MSLLLLILIILILLGGGSLGWHHGYDNWTGGGIGLGTVLLIVLIVLILRGRI